MTDEKNLVSMTILVDRESCIALHRTCAKCGATAQSKPLSFEHADYATGMKFDSEVFVVRQAMPPEGWEHLRMTDPEKTWHLEVCPKCIREFFGVKAAEEKV